MSTTPPISMVMHTRNSEATLEQALASVDWCDERIVVDMQSSDRSVAIAESKGAQVKSAQPVPRIDSIRNSYIDQATHEWVLVLDSDEHLPADAEEAIRALVKTHGEKYDAFSLPRYNQIMGQVLRGSQWYPDYQIRLFKKGAVQWGDRHHAHPEVVTGSERLYQLEPPNCLHIHHQNYPDVASFLRKQLEYAITDSYDKDPKSFNFDEYVGAAYQAYASRHDTPNDGDLSHVLATVMAWDTLLRGLLHWEQCEPRPKLNPFFSLPLAATEREGAYAEVEHYRQELAKANKKLEAKQQELVNMEETAVWKSYQSLQKRFPKLIQILSKLRRQEETK